MNLNEINRLEHLKKLIPLLKIRHDEFGTEAKAIEAAQNEFDSLENKRVAYINSHEFLSR
jgi:hypothetical protein